MKTTSLTLALCLFGVTLGSCAVPPKKEKPAVVEAVDEREDAGAQAERDPQFSKNRRVDGRKVFSQEGLALEKRTRKVYRREKPKMSPLVITESPGSPPLAWMARQPAWNSIKTALVFNPASIGHNASSSQITLGNAVDGKLIERGLQPIDRTLLTEMEREIWLARKVLVDMKEMIVPALSWGWRPLLMLDSELTEMEREVWLARKVLVDMKVKIVPALPWGWKPLLMLDSERVWASVLHGSEAMASGPRPGFFNSAQVIFELDGPHFDSIEFELPVMLLDGVVEEVVAAPPYYATNRTREAMDSVMSDGFGGEVEHFNPSFMDPRTGTFWGLTGIYRQAGVRLDQYMHWMYKDEFPDHTYCAQCGILTDKAKALELPDGMNSSYEALKILTEAGQPENEALASPTVQALVNEMEEAFREQTPWQRLNSTIPHVAPVWQCPVCERSQHVQFLIGYHPEADNSPGCDEGDWRSYATWGAGNPADGVYTILAPPEQVIERGWTEQDGKRTAPDFIAHVGGFRHEWEEIVAVVKNGESFLVPAALVEIDADSGSCRLPMFDESGRQVYGSIEDSPEMVAGSILFIDRTASLGCRIVETESSRVLGVVNLRLSYREIMGDPVQVPVENGRVASERWADIGQQDRALTLALADRLISLLPLK